MKIIMVAPHLPAPTIGVNTRNYHLLRALAREHDVSVVTLAYEHNQDIQADVARLDGLAHELRVAAPPTNATKRLTQVQHLLRGQSYRVMASTFPALQDALDELCARERFDIALCESVLSAGYRLPPTTRVLIDQHNIEYELLRRTAAQAPLGSRKVYNWLESRRLEPIELARCAAAAAVTVTSQRERMALMRRLPHSRIEVVPNGVDLAFFSRDAVSSQSSMPASDGPRIVFTGAMNYFPNVDAAIMFAQSCWPRIQEQIPNATWYIVGNNPPPAVRRLAELPGVTVTGFVPDVRPYLAGASVAIAPLLVGGGTRLKILEAFAMRLPVVSTSLGCEGLDVVSGEHLLVADTPADLIAATVRCLRDASLRASLAEAGFALAHAEYSWDQIGERLLRVVRTLGAGARRTATGAAV